MRHNIYSMIARIERVEKEAGANYPTFLVTFKDGSRKLMRAYELFFYAVNRSLYLDGYKNNEGLFNGDPLPDTAFVDYSLASGDPSLITPFIKDEIEAMKGK